jgi:hypothetical protein
LAQREVLRWTLQDFGKPIASLPSVQSYCRGKAQALMGHPERAKAFFKEATDLDPANRKAAVALRGLARSVAP